LLGVGAVEPPAAPPFGAWVMSEDFRRVASRARRDDESYCC